MIFSGAVVPGARFDPYRPPLPDDERPRTQNPGYGVTVLDVYLASRSLELASAELHP